MICFKLCYLIVCLEKNLFNRCYIKQNYHYIILTSVILWTSFLFLASSLSLSTLSFSACRAASSASCCFWNAFSNWNIYLLVLHKVLQNFSLEQKILFYLSISRKVVAKVTARSWARREHGKQCRLTSGCMFTKLLLDQLSQILTKSPPFYENRELGHQVCL